MNKRLISILLSVCAATLCCAATSCETPKEEHSWKTDYTYNETTGEFATVQSRITVPAATYEQDAETGAWIITPGVSTLVITGSI